MFSKETRLSVNIRDLAKEANVSPATVSKVLNRRDVSVSAETRERILRLAKEHNYVPASPPGCWACCCARDCPPGCFCRV